MKKSSCRINQNLAANLRVRQDDKVKIEKLGESGDDSDRSGDLILVQQTEPAIIQSATFSPVEDSLSALVGQEGGDDIPDDEIMSRFVEPYMQGGGGLLKKGNLLTLRDENGLRLEFYVSHLGLDGEAETHTTADEGAYDDCLETRKF